MVVLRVLWSLTAPLIVFKVCVQLSVSENFGWVREPGAFYLT